MKNKQIGKAIAIVAALVLLVAAVPVSAFTFTPEQQVSGIGTIVTNETQTLTNGLVYNKTTYVDADSNGQTLFAMEFNPDETGYMPMVYQAKPSYGRTTEESIAAAEAEGYEVLGAINGEFGSANVENWGTLDSRMITNGRVIADSEFRDVMCLAFDKDGTFQLVQSELSYHFYVEGKEILNAENGDAVIGCINKRYVGTNWWNPYCYFDYATGGATYTNENVKGVEVVFDKLHGTELVVEGVLQGKVVSVNTDTYGTAMTENQFVLYAQNGSANYDALAGLQVGQEVQIYVEELNKESKTIMKNAVTVTGATYPIVVNGVDNTNNTPNAGDIYMTRAQRTAIGVKADGTLVFVATKGRGDSATYDKGITLPQLAALMISLDCEYAVNLDGGGSTTFVTGDTTQLTEGRGVSSSILICKRNEAMASPAEKAALEQWVADAEKQTYPTTQQEKVDAAVAKAAIVLNDANATTADYVRESMAIASAMGVVTDVAPKNYISLNAKDWSYDTKIMQAANDANGALVFNNTNSQWPAATFLCEMNVLPSDTLYFDLTVAGQSSVNLYTSDGTEIKLNKFIAPDSIDVNSEDIIGNGKTFKGSINVSQIKAAGFDIASVKIFAVGGKGDGSKVTVRELAFRNPYSGGDIDGSGQVDSSDARFALRHISGKEVLDGIYLSAADANGDGKVDTEDVRYMLKKRVALV